MTRDERLLDALRALPLRLLDPLRVEEPLREDDPALREVEPALRVDDPTPRGDVPRDALPVRDEDVLRGDDTLRAEPALRAEPEDRWRSGDVMLRLDAPRVVEDVRPALRDELALSPVVERPVAVLFPAAVRPPAERAPVARAPADRADPTRELAVRVELELERVGDDAVRVLRVEVPRGDAVRVAEEREDEERVAADLFVEPPLVDREPDFAVVDRRVVVAIAIVR